ncbi:hypothetical protein E5676_scaffold325G001110 [Cucumis melo var. makuwa]|uniref:Uncharacterized protein n=1 Tax=Cucumis melo var. makuwa TaxID=1194695 RepID=A0A5A7V9W7_CUCMM|nr:hypothetical protein E6C27_scaffold130G00490 [Cucumis melo var. makuwa]TYK27421.1 hypothetical protein E5676_scaffold325G001110 [Cucumis melo var. makuwa]
MSIGNTLIPDTIKGIFRCFRAASDDSLYKRFNYILHRTENERERRREKRRFIAICSSSPSVSSSLRPSPPSATLVMVAFFVLNLLLFGMVSRGGSRIA